MHFLYLASFPFFISRTFHDQTTLRLCMPISVTQRLFWRSFINSAIAFLFAANILKEALKFGILLLDIPGNLEYFFLQNVIHLFNYNATRWTSRNLIPKGRFQSNYSLTSCSWSARMTLPPTLYKTVRGFLFVFLFQCFQLSFKLIAVSLVPIWFSVTGILCLPKMNCSSFACHETIGVRMLGMGCILQ